MFYLMAETNLLAAKLKKKKNFYKFVKKTKIGIENWGSRKTNASGSGGANWPWTGEKSSSDRLRDLRLSFFSDCASMGSISVVGAGIVLRLGFTLYRDREKEK